MFLLSAGVAVVYAKAISFQSSKFPTDEEACAANTWSLEMRKTLSVCVRRKKGWRRKKAKQHQRPSPMGHWILIFIL
jgi:hypothetical protein